MKKENTAKQFIAAIKTYRSPEHAEKLQSYFKTGKGEYGEGDEFIGLRMGQIRDVAKDFIDLPLPEIEGLLESSIHEVRMGGLVIMDRQARSRKTPESRRKEMFDLYLRRTDRINNWDLVDVSAPRVVGGYLFDKPRDVLYRLARSKNLWERRIAILSTAFFIQHDDLDDTFRIAEMLLGDDQDLIHKATGWLLREAGKKDPERLHAFLERHAATMPRTALRYAIERLDKAQRDHYLGMKNNIKTVPY